MRLYDVDQGWRLRKDITTRMCRCVGGREGRGRGWRGLQGFGGGGACSVSRQGLACFELAGLSWLDCVERASDQDQDQGMDAGTDTGTGRGFGTSPMAPGLQSIGGGAWGLARVWGGGARGVECVCQGCGWVGWRGMGCELCSAPLLQGRGVRMRVRHPVTVWPRMYTPVL